MKQNRTWMFMLLLIPGLATAKFYKWVDAEGNVHYDQKPPPSQMQGEEVRIQPKTSFGEAPPPPTVAEEPPKPEEGQTETAEGEKSPPPATGLSPEELAKRNCEQAKENFASYNNNKRVAVPGADNAVRELNEEERQAKIKEAQGYVDRFCK